MSEQSERASKRTSKCPSTYVSIHGCSEPQCAETENTLDSTPDCSVMYLSCLFFYSESSNHTFVCPVDKFVCPQSKECVPHHWRCDRNADCTLVKFWEWNALCLFLFCYFSPKQWHVSFLGGFDFPKFAQLKKIEYGQEYIDIRPTP